MSGCYADQLGDCEGKIELEHFIPKSLQQMLGSVKISGFAWQETVSNELPPNSYANSRILCKKHHDQLDGLDGNARDYFRNLMLIAGQNHVATGKKGKSTDISYDLDGRSLERWFLKLICGAIKSDSFSNVATIPHYWIQALFCQIPWPSDWALYIFTGGRTTRREDANMNIDFVWANDRSLNGVLINAFSVQSMFSMSSPDLLPPNALRRPRMLGFNVARPHGGDILDGIPAGQNIEFRIRWPEG